MQLAEGIQSAARGFREFDEEHAVVHKATEGAKQAWRDLRQASGRGGKLVGTGVRDQSDEDGVGTIPNKSNIGVGKRN